jgi:hypothetical protein
VGDLTSELRRDEQTARRLEKLRSEELDKILR